MINQLTREKVNNPTILIVDTLRRKDPVLAAHVERRFEVALMETIDHFTETQQKELFDTTKSLSDPSIVYCPTVNNKAVFDIFGIEIIDDMRIRLPPNWTIHPHNGGSYDLRFRTSYDIHHGHGGSTYIDIDSKGVATRTLTDIGSVIIYYYTHNESNNRVLESLGMTPGNRCINVPRGWHANYNVGFGRIALHYPVYADRYSTNVPVRAFLWEKGGTITICDKEFVKMYKPK